MQVTECRGGVGRGSLWKICREVKTKAWLCLFVYPNIHINLCIKRKTSLIALHAQPDLDSNQCHLGKEKLAVLHTVPVFLKLNGVHCMLGEKKKSLRPNRKLSLNL